MWRSHFSVYKNTVKFRFLQQNPPKSIFHFPKYSTQAAASLCAAHMLFCPLTRRKEIWTPPSETLEYQSIKYKWSTGSKNALICFSCIAKQFKYFPFTVKKKGKCFRNLMPSLTCFAIQHKHANLMAYLFFIKNTPPPKKKPKTKTNFINLLCQKCAF